jgi:hypothetical protein
MTQLVFHDLFESAIVLDAWVSTPGIPSKNQNSNHQGASKTIVLVFLPLLLGNDDPPLPLVYR